ncbi:glycoside hydrolase family 16 protein [Metarhizium robertsii]|uniref:Endo-1,3(4)-beta-glucanase n=2 Tax=Metarhizium robertsii TaxID=568076 RepID=E9EZS6_METRA|nr:endo-1,3(4)-beta-glucanase [Metarhizium robertsii ARSEF 23]EFY99467.1 endo-1,3(4)-beta-glucanase [Metarhizium robertsii ARSEF 23]EXV04491.1 glycoside hydrolase family 16 protein [Metarhizium robertsii]
MVNHRALLSLLAFAHSTTAWGAPGYGGFTLRWQDSFPGAAGTSPNTGNWNLVEGYLNVNNELQRYSPSTRNLQISGGQTVQLVPWRDGSTRMGWTSGRMESRYVFTPDAGRVTRVEATLRFGGAPQPAKQGIWPAFWLLGDSIRHGVQWPTGGELDIMERVNGLWTGYGTVHCGYSASGGTCNEPNGFGGAVGIPDDGWHVWRLEFDRRSGDWAQQTITWFMDGRQFHQISGARIGDYNLWVALCQKPQFFILNLAVGGNWPGYPNGNTQDGYGSMMEVAYVAHYST